MKYFLTGINGQDGSYLSELLLKEGHEVYGVIRRNSSPETHTKRIDNIIDPESRDKIFYGDLEEGFYELILNIKPDVIVNTAAQSHVWISFKQPQYTYNVNSNCVLKLLEDIRKCEKVLDKKIKFIQCSSSEMFGTTPPIQNESSLFNPVSPYGIAKTASFYLTKMYKNAYNIFASNSISFNHCSPKRGVNFVTRKITRSGARIACGLQKKLYLGNVESKRDESHAKDIVKGIYLISKHNEPDDFVLASGEMHSVYEWVEKVFKYFNLNIDKHLHILEELKRPLEVPELCGDASKAKSVLGWKPEYTFDSLVQEMCEEDYKESLNELKLKENI